MERTQRLLSMIDASGVGLEIGPGYNPLLRKSAGYRVETLDHGTADEIRDKYRNDPSVDISQIEEVDFVWDGRPLSQVVGKPGHYDYVVASHVIEHTTDLVGFLKECQTLLKPDGLLLLAVPDKRRCFDVLQPMTTTGAVLQAHLERRTRHPPGLVFDYIAYGTLRGGASGWLPGSSAPLSFASTVPAAKQFFDHAQASKEYIDAHAWRFTPSSFRIIMRDLQEIGEIELRQKEFHESEIHEFYISLSRRGSGCPFDRLTLAKMALVELQEIVLEDSGASDQRPITAMAPSTAPLPPEPRPPETRPPEPQPAPAVSDGRLRVAIVRGGQRIEIEPEEFEDFAFRSGDELSVIPPELAATLPNTWGDINVRLRDGRAIRVPPRYELFEYKGFQLPVHLIRLTGAGPETFDAIGKGHITTYRKHVGLEAGMTIVDIGCGIGRDGFQLFDVLNREGRYVGIDVTRDSIVWCQRNISRRYPNYEFHHFDAENELYNPYGSKKSMDFSLPLRDGTVDRIVLASVFTHLFAEEVLHYMKEFRRVLKPSGLVYASFFLRTPEALEAAKTKGNTAWKATFHIPLGGGAYANDPDYPRGAVAFTDEAMRRMIDEAGLRLVKPYLKGWWSGLHEEADDGQDVAILGL